MIRCFWLRPLQLGGLTLLAMGIWVSVDGGSFLQLLGPFSSQGMQFVNVGFFCISIGAVLVLLGLLGCCGAHKESKCLLLVVGNSGPPGGGGSPRASGSAQMWMEHLPRSLLITLGNISLSSQTLTLREKLGFSWISWCLIADLTSAISHQ